MPIFTEALKDFLLARSDSPSSSRPPRADVIGGRRAERVSLDAENKASRVGPLIAYQNLGSPVWSPRDYSAFAREGFMQNAIVYRSVRMIAEAAASIPLLLYEGGIEVEQHPLLDLIRRPSLDHTSTDFLEAWYGFLLVSGNAYVEAVAVDGEIRELHNLRPDRMKVLPGLDGWPEGYEYSAGGNSVRFIDDTVPGVRPILHTRLFHPANDHYGMSPIEAAATAIDIHNTASGWNKALLDNSARPSGALVYAASNGQMTDDQFARLKSELETSFQGAAHAGRPLLLEGGLDWKPLSMTPKDMDFIEAKNSAAREIALAIGVPPILLGIPGDATYSNYAEAQRAFWRSTVLPLATRMAKALSMWLAPHFALGDSPSSSRPPSAGDLELLLDLDQVEALAPEREALWTRLEAASFLTDDEKRAAAGYGPKEAGTVTNAPFPVAASPSDPAALKYNQNHDEAGRFTFADGAGAGGGRDVMTAGLGGIASNLLKAGLGLAKPMVKRLYQSLKGIANKAIKFFRRPPSFEKLPSYLKPRPGVGKTFGTAEDLAKMTAHEKRLASELHAQGHNIELIPTSAKKTSDWFIDGVRTEIKEVSKVASKSPDGMSRAISRVIEKNFRQGPNFLIDARGQAGMTEKIAKRVIQRTLGKDENRVLRTITVLTKDGPVSVTRGFFTKSAVVADWEVRV